jgi:hypothetical protein
MNSERKARMKDVRKILDRAMRVLDIARNMSTSMSVTHRLADIQLHCNGYSEAGYNGEVIATGNWNAVTHWDNKINKVVTDSILPERVAHIFERMGIQTEWNDEWTTCHSCDRLVRTQPDSYSWKPNYYMNEFYEVVCKHCWEESTYN